MELGIAGKNAIVCASSKGLGLGCAEALAAEGVNITMTARGSDALESAAEAIRLRYPAIKVSTAAGDISTEEGRRHALSVAGNVDILVNNAGGPPPGDFRDWSRDDWLKALDLNMLAPIEMIRATIDGMIDRKFGRIVNITSSSVKSAIPALGLSNGARTGLTGFIAGLSRQVAQHNVTINGLLPGAMATSRLKSIVSGEALAASLSEDEIITQRLTSIPAKRFGQPNEFGALCAFLCGQSAGYLTGQNIVIDGGAFPGTL
ncbi:SDR family oxidoreductase [Croceicoccus bisphenolivorans]|uniref:SDR family oxidoreductase n=1 Tax=Croceicoccus bisphenolivorans TaxID=1783232 RepID=UPI00082DD338|nr:SDR family oxidoreductase [Croceicoccus bisphenolivorans]